MKVYICFKNRASIPLAFCIRPCNHLVACWQYSQMHRNLAAIPATKVSGSYQTVLADPYKIVPGSRHEFSNNFMQMYGLHVFYLIGTDTVRLHGLYCHLSAFVPALLRLLKQSRETNDTQTWSTRTLVVSHTFTALTSTFAASTITLTDSALQVLGRPGLALSRPLQAFPWSGLVTNTQGQIKIIVTFTLVISSRIFEPRV